MILLRIFPTTRMLLTVAVISSSILIAISSQVTAIVRKELAVAVRDLMHHGLNQVRVRNGLNREYV